MSKNTIYCFTNKINDKKYIGSTVVEPNIRYNQHIYCATHEENNKYNYPLYQAIRKYGIENFTFEIIEQKECTEEEIRLLEHEYIIQFNTVAPNGYNQTDNTTHPLNAPETYQKMKETKRENAKRVAEIDNNNNVLQVWRSIIDCYEDTGINATHIASCCRGERHTVSQRRFAWLDDNNNVIIPKYIGDTYKGAPGTTQVQSKSKKVAKIDLKTNMILATYDTVALAARENQCDASGICKVCNGKRNQCGNFKWKYIENN
jgi:group I intron endonuclease